MGEREDKPHTLIISDPGDGDEREWQIVHPPTCPWNAWRCDCADPLFNGPHLHFHRTCLAQYEVDNNGIDSLDPVIHGSENEHLDSAHVKVTPFESGWLRLLPGRYRIVAWYTPGGWAGDYYDADGGVYISEVVSLEPVSTRG